MCKEARWAGCALIEQINGLRSSPAAAESPPPGPCQTGGPLVPALWLAFFPVNAPLTSVKENFALSKNN